MAPPTDPPTTITLRIKVPPGHIEGTADEFTLGTEVPVIARIGEVRERIQRTIPSNPSPERQRLLYGGRALVDNDQTLADALNIRRDPTQTEYVVHLLVKGDGAATVPAPHRRGLSTPGRASPAQAGQQSLQGSERAHQPGQGQAQIHAHAHAHTHDDPIQQQHLQQHQAGILAQQQRLLHDLHHNHLAAGQGQGLIPFGMQPMQLGAGFPMFPAGQQFGQHHGQGMPQQLAQQAPTQVALQQQGPVVHADGTADSRPPQSSSATRQTEGQQRSTSQPPRPQGHGVVLEGRGPNGEQFHFQQHVQHVQLGPRPQAVLPPGFGAHHIAPQQPLPRRTGPTALEQARDNIAEMRRMLVELRGLDAGTEEQQDRIDRIQQRTQEVNNYIDPLNLGGSNAARARNSAQGVPVSRSASQPPVQGAMPDGSSIGQQQAPSPRSPSEVTCYLLSSATGPQAILYSPQHGTYTGRMAPVPQTAAGIHPTQTTQPAAAPAVANHQPPANAVHAIAAQPGVAQVAAAQQDGLGGFGPGLANHVWLLMRVLIFAYFILGANLGWRRPLALLAIALGFWLLRQGPLGEGGVLRRWWDGIVNQNQRPQPARAIGQQRAQDQAGEARAGQMPTPAQVAQRLLEEDREQRNYRLSWLREQIRPAERAIALLIASLWPGLGEAYVRALEAEERRRNEEEVAARRREEEDRQRREEGEKKQAEEKAQGTGGEGSTKPEVTKTVASTADATRKEEAEYSNQPDTAVSA